MLTQRPDSITHMLARTQSLVCSLNAPTQTLICSLNAPTQSRTRSLAPNHSHTRSRSLAFNHSHAHSQSTLKRSCRVREGLKLQGGSMTLLLAPAGPTYDTNLNTAGGQNTTKQLRIISNLRRDLMVKVLWCNKRNRILGESAVVQQETPQPG